MLSPIIVFSFNRLIPLQRLIYSLAANTESVESDLYVFVDGARTDKEGEMEKVHSVQRYVQNIEGFKSVQYHFSDVNHGLGPSIIYGTTEVLRKYGKAIVLEDDLILSSNFLSYMNQGLDRYEKEKEIFSICGYSSQVKRPDGYSADSYFCTRSSSWGWGTWLDRWETVNWSLNDFYQYKKYRKTFNNWGGSDCWHMLNDWHDGRNKSWAIRFCFSQFLQNKLSLFPLISKVANEGFDGEGTNCRKYSRFKYDFDTGGKKTFIWPTEIKMNKHLYSSAKKYHSLSARLYSKIMYLIYG